MAEVERAVVGALEKQYADLLAPLKDLLVPKKFTLQYMQKLTRRQKPYIYSVPSQVESFFFRKLCSDIISLVVSHVMDMQISFHVLTMCS